MNASELMMIAGDVVGGGDGRALLAVALLIAIAGMAIAILGGGDSRRRCLDQFERMP
jgi:uncharacterized membrane protein